MINKDNIEENDTYIFDRGYISSEWWSIINNSKAFFITRNFKHFSYEVLDVLYDINNNNNNINNNIHIYNNINIIII